MKKFRLLFKFGALALLLMLVCLAHPAAASIPPPMFPISK